VRRTSLAACAIGAVAAGALGAGLETRSGAGPPPPSAISDALPRPVAPAFTPSPGRPLRHTRVVAYWAPVRRAATARRAPGARAQPVARVATTTPEGTANIVRVLGRRTDRAGRLWIRVSLATLPNGRTGWLPRKALGGYGTVDTHLLVDVHRLTATLLKRGRPIFRAPVGVGQPHWPTPRGRFYIRNRLTRYAGPTYGPLAFGTSARSARFTDWPGGGFIGIHGTDKPTLIPGRISHGCIRMRNADIVALGHVMPVGTPVTIR
jgi:hypothetical protein